MQRLVDAVHPRIGVAHRRDHDLGGREGLLEVGHHRNRTALPGEHRLDAPRLDERRPGRVGERALERHGGAGTLGSIADPHPGTPGRVLLQMCGQRGQCLTGVGVRGDPYAHLGPRRRRQRVRGVGDAGGVDADHGGGRLGPQPSGDRALAEQPDAVERPALGAQPALGVVQLRVGHRAQPLDRDVAVGVVQGGQQPAQRGQRVGDGAAVLPGMQRMIEGGHLDDAVDQATQRGGERGFADIPVAGVGDHVGVGGEQVTMPLEDRGQRCRPDLFLALDEQCDAHRRFAAESPQRGQVHHHTCLVVGHAAAEEPSVGLAYRERIGRPQRDVAGGLHVVMRVQTDRRSADRTGEAGDHRRLPALGDDPDVVATERPDLRHDPLGALLHVAGMGRQGAHRRDRHQGGQVVDNGREDGVHGVTDIHGGTLLGIPDSSRSHPVGG